MIDIESSILTLLEDSAEKVKNIFNFKETPPIALDAPRESGFGDLASNAALQIGRMTRHPAMEIAHIMVDSMKARLKEEPFKDIIKDIEASAPGFINFFLKEESLYYILDKIIKEGRDYGRSDIGRGIRVNLEFVSANPTGPLTIAHGRQAAFGDSLANILEFSGYRVKREYYINDEGRQIDTLGRSIQAKYLELINEPAAFPEDGYKGEYIGEMALGIKKRYGAKKKSAPAGFFTSYGYNLIIREIKKDIREFGVKFDVWYSQRHLRTSGRIKKALMLLAKKNLTYSAEGALWFKSAAYGDEKDRVIIKSDGSFTYFGPDIAYHLDKHKRGFENLIDIWGPDHHGYIPRMKAAMAGLGYKEASFTPLIVQLVTLYRNDVPVRMSTRAGSFITLNEVVSEIGRDCARYFFLRRRRDSHLDFDLELAKKHSLDNPVYYVQYGHARISSILKYEKESSRFSPGEKPDPGLLKSKEELKILRILRGFPLMVRSSAEECDPYRVLSYLEELAKGFHSFYNKHRVVSDDRPLSKARLLLVECVKIVIANGLRLLGVAAPAQM